MDLDRLIPKATIAGLALCFLSLAAVGYINPAEATTSWDVHNVPKMYLYRGISTTQTTNIQLTGPVINGTISDFPTQSGGIIELTQGSKVEKIYYSIATINATTKVVTLTGTVVRDIPWNSTTSFTTGGNGQQFQRGATAKLSNDARLFNLSAYRDRVDTMIGSGAILCGATNQPCLISNGLTTAQIQGFTYGTAAGLYPIVFDTTKGSYVYWDGSKWVNFGSGSIVNALFDVSGKVEFGSGSELLQRTVSGSTTARLAVGTTSLTMTGGIAYANGYIPVLNSDGFIPTSVGGTGTGYNLGTGGVMFTQGTGAIVEISGTPTSSTFVRGDKTWGAPLTLFGSGGSGAVTLSADTQYDPVGNFNFTTFTLDASRTLSLSASNAVLRINATSNVTINGTVDLNNSGGSGGTIGIIGGAGQSYIKGYDNDSGAPGSSAGGAAGGGGGGASSLADGTAGVNGSGTGGAGGTTITDRQLAMLQSASLASPVCGGGGGGGGNDTNEVDDNGKGGNGGGCSLWFIGGNLTLGASSAITANAENGQVGETAQGGGAGGGGGGHVVIIVAGTITDNGVTLSATAGAGGAGVGASGAGSAGGAGLITIYSLTDGRIITN
jgi:hypothetical protein